MFIRWLKNHNGNDLMGLDIGSDFIKLLKINSIKQPYLIENFSIEATPSGAILNGEIKEYARIGEVIKSMLRKSGITTANFALAIPRSSVIIKNITIDKRLSQEEVESRAWIEANRLFPDLIGNIYLSFDILGPSSKDSSQIELMLVACRKEQVNPYIEVLHSHALNAKIVDVNSYALKRALHVIMQQQTSPLETVAYINLDFNLSTLIVIHNKDLIFAHDQTFQGHHLIEQLKNYKNPTNDKIDEDAGQLTILKENLNTHLRHIMHFFYSSKPNINLQQVIIGGDFANIPHLAPVAQQEIGVETVIADPFKNMELAPQVDAEKLKIAAPSLMLCCGLALSKT